jgi:hypothetical protein
LGVEDFEDLGLVGFGVGVDLFAGEGLAGDVAAGGVADERGEVADEEDDLVAELLEVAQLAHEHGVAEVKIGGGGVESGFDAEGAAGFERVFERRSRRSLTRMISAAPFWSRSSCSETEVFSVGRWACRLQV